MVGGPQIRNIGTIGGNTCNGVTSADSASTLHAWDAVIELTGKNGVRRLPIHDFYIKAGKVDIRAEDGEIQTAVLIPKESYENCFGHYIKYAMRNAMDIATLGTSVNVRLSRRQKDGGAGPSGLRRGGAGAPAGSHGGSDGKGPAREPGTSGAVCPGGDWRTSTPGIPGGPAKDFRHAHRRGERQAGIYRIGEAGGR